MAVFSLNEVRSLQVKNKDTNFASWPENLEKSNFTENYVFLGSNVSKYTFSTDTASLPGNQLYFWVGSLYGGGTVHANYLGAGIGYLSTSPAYVRKFDVTNETNTSLISGVIPSSDTGYGASMSLTHSPTAFYAHGGANPPFGKTNINRMPFSDETVVHIGTGAFPEIVSLHFQVQQMMLVLFLLEKGMVVEVHMILMKCRKLKDLLFLRRLILN